ncbi:MAG: precorrin-3B C(17)-methyltransferase [Deltaproteobacteria bacterium]|nr:precorrin-3B C(17)-methyltransferase [Deltaproteobacteria bacterium]
MVGLGSGGPKGITLAAREALAGSEIVLGYKLYLDEAKSFLPPGCRVESSGMTAEIGRAGRALELALAGKNVSLVSGGDPGVYAMAGAVFEVAREKKIPLGPGPGEVEIEVLTGTPALTAAAALLGAPLTHDFCAISLSDRLTRWETIEKRLALASEAGFVIALYNPKSRGRAWQLGRAAEILTAGLGPDVPVGLAARVGREGQSVRLTTLGKLSGEDVDMQTVVIVGNRSTVIYDGRMVTPRGYVDKYGASPGGGKGASAEDSPAGRADRAPATK